MLIIPFANRSVDGMMYLVRDNSNRENDDTTKRGRRSYFNDLCSRAHATFIQIEYISSIEYTVTRYSVETKFSSSLHNQYL